MDGGFVLTIVFRVWGLVHYGLSLCMAQQFWVVYDSIMVGFYLAL